MNDLDIICLSGYYSETSLTTSNNYIYSLKLKNIYSLNIIIKQ